MSGKGVSKRSCYLQLILTFSNLEARPWRIYANVACNSTSEEIITARYYSFQLSFDTYRTNCLLDRFNFQSVFITIIPPKLFFP